MSNERSKKSNIRQICFETNNWPRIESKVLLPSGSMGFVKSYNFSEGRVEVEYDGGDWSGTDIGRGDNCVTLKPELLIKLDG